MTRSAGPVLFIGDSITFSWADLRPPGRLNRGAPGETTEQMRDRLVRQLAETDAGGLHILGGVNDIAGAIGLEQTRTNLRLMAEAGAARRVEVWIGSLTPASRIWWSPMVADVGAQIVQLNSWIKADARALGCTFIDYHGALADPEGGLAPTLGEDGLHLNSAGYDVMTRLAKAALGPAWPVDSVGVSR